MRRVRLFIFNFKKIIFEIGIFCICVFALEKMYEYFIYDDTMEEARAIMYDFYRQEEIDNLFLGCSHVYFDINPSLLNEYTGKNNFNLSTPFQPLIASYHLLREADKRYEIEHVYLEMYYIVSLYDSSILNNWRVYDYMPTSWNKLDYMLHAGAVNERYQGFFRARRMWQNALDIEKMRDILRKKQSDNYREHKWVKINEHGIEYFAPGGYLYTEYILDYDLDERPENVTELSEYPLSDEAEKYLFKILEYCRDNDINITLFFSPLTQYRLAEYSGKDKYLRQIEAIAEEFNIEYYDFNLCKKQYLNLEDAQYWRDWEHLNIWGAERFTKTFYDIVIRQSAVDKEKYFYPCYEDE